MPPITHQYQFLYSQAVSVCLSVSLQVLPANPEAAWLGVQQQQQQGPRFCDPAGHTLEFSSIHEALQEAQDGDIIHLLPGTHGTQVESIHGPATASCPRAAAQQIAQMSSTNRVSSSG
jgi:hypothetical protein